MASETRWTIGQLAGRVGVTPDALRYYERLGVLAPAGRTSSGFRLYTADTVDRVRFIKQAQRHGFTLAEIRELLRVDARGGGSRCRHVRQLLTRRLTDLDDRLRELQTFRDLLDEYRSRCDRALADTADAACPVVDDLWRRTP